VIVARSIRTLLSAGIFAAAAWVPDALAAAGTAPTGFADRGRTPSASELAALRQKLADQQLVRLMGPSISERDIERPLVDSSGVRSANWTPRRSGLFVSADAPPAHAEAPVPWSQITEIQTGHTMTNRGMLIGAALGLFASGFVMTGITRSSSTGGGARDPGRCPGGARDRRPHRCVDRSLAMAWGSRLPRGCGAMNAHAIEADFGYDGLDRQPSIAARDPGDRNAPQAHRWSDPVQ